MSEKEEERTGGEERKKGIKKVPVKGTGTKWSWQCDLNTRPTHYECVALPTELCQRTVLKGV